MAAISAGRSAQAISRNKDGGFCPEKFAGVATDPQIKMVELKPASARAWRRAAGGESEQGDCRDPRGEMAGTHLPARHSAFATPIEMMQFIASLRSLSGREAHSNARPRSY
jgi:hypothetical protein